MRLLSIPSSLSVTVIIAVNFTHSVAPPKKPKIQQKKSFGVLELRPAGKFSGMVFAPVGNGLITGNADGALQIWDAVTGKLKRNVAVHKNGIASLALSNDGKTIATGGQDGSLRLWNAENGKELHYFQEKRGCVFWIAFANKGKEVFFAASGSASKFALTREGPVFDFT